MIRSSLGLPTTVGQECLWCWAWLLIPVPNESRSSSRGLLRLQAELGAVPGHWG